MAVVEPAQAQRTSASSARHLRAVMPGLSVLAWITLLCLGSCKACPPRAEDFSTPSAAVAGLQQALGKRDSIALYRCLSEGFKERTDLGALATDIALDYLLEEYPEIEYLESGTIVSERRLSSDYALVEVEVGFLFFTRQVRFVLERRTLAEIRREGLTAPISSYRPLGSRVLDTARWSEEEPNLAFVLDQTPDLWEQVQVADPPITAFQIVDVWKVHAIAVTEEEAQGLGVTGAPNQP